MASAQRSDAIVIGSGQGGVPLAADLARAGKSVVLFERAELGGTCINSGCTPSKTFLAAARTAGRARIDGAGVYCVHGEASFVDATDVTAVWRDAREITAILSNGTSLAADALLVATGRVPNTAALRCDAAGVALDSRGYVVIDDHFRTSAAGVYAIGDVAGQPALHPRLVGRLPARESDRRGERALSPRPGPRL